MCLRSGLLPGVLRHVEFVVFPVLAEEVLVPAPFDHGAVLHYYDHVRVAYG